MMYVREDILSKVLIKYTFTEPIEGLFIEIKFHKTKLLFFGSYHQDHPEFDVSTEEYFNQVCLDLDKYSSVEKFLMAGDFNTEGTNKILVDFMVQDSVKNLVKEPTCFKSLTNPSCIGVFITNSPLSFQSTTTRTTSLCDFLRMIVTVVRSTFPKAALKIIHYCDYNEFEGN